jgi:hypothetical protein
MGFRPIFVASLCVMAAAALASLVTFMTMSDPDEGLYAVGAFFPIVIGGLPVGLASAFLGRALAPRLAPTSSRRGP